MNNRRSLENRKLKKMEIASTFCIFTGFWGAAVLGQYQLYARLRFSLPAFSIVDYILLGLGFILGIIGARLWKNKKSVRLLIGLAGTSLTAFLAYLILPVMPFANQAIPPLHMGTIEITPLSPILSLLSFFGILNASSMFCRRTDYKGIDAVRDKLIMCIALAVSAGLGFFVISLRPDSHGSLIYLSISGLIGIVGFWLNIFQPQLKGEIHTTDNIVAEKKNWAIIGFEIIHMTVTWLYSSIGLVILMHLINVSMSDPREVVIFQLFYVSVAIGTGVIMLFVILEQQPDLSRIRKVLLALMGSSSTLLIHWAIKEGKHTHEFFRYICYGIGIVCFLTIEIEHFSSSKYPAVVASAFILALGITGYTSFIPAKMSSLVEGTSSLFMDIGLYVTFSLLLIVEIFNFILNRIGKNGSRKKD